MSWPQSEKLTQSVVAMLRVNLGLQSSERLLVISDLPSENDWQLKETGELEEMLERAMLGRMLADIAAANYPSNRVSFHVFPATGSHGAEPDEATARLMLKAEVILYLTTYSLSHTNARAEAGKNGARIASMPQFEISMLAPDGPLAVDTKQVSADVKRFATLLSTAKQATVRTEYGTDLHFSLEGRQGRIDDGLFLSPGSFGNLPAGEAYIAPLEGSGEGHLVVLPDCPAGVMPAGWRTGGTKPPGWYPGLQDAMTLYFEKGEVVKLAGVGTIGDQFRRQLNLESDDPKYKSRRNLAELGIGCNPNARRPDNVLEAEKIKGSVHIAIGDNAHMGGQVDSDLHEDFVQPQPDLILDGKAVIVKGKWQ